MLIRYVFVVVLLPFTYAPFGHAQDVAALPSDTEIQLLLTQADRAIQQYKPLLDEEAVQLGKSGAGAVARDRQVVHALETALSAFEKQPQAFNSPAGFAFFEWLDDASRNALLCSSTSMNQLSDKLMQGSTKEGTELVHLFQGCMDVSTLFYTVSENAGSLYERYIKAEEALAQKGFNVAQKCTDVLKQKSDAKKQ
jgi:hypothetical protein